MCLCSTVLQQHFFSFQQSAERCVSTLLDLIQTKVNYVVQEAIVVIRDIFRKYPNKYVSFGTPESSLTNTSNKSVFDMNVVYFT